MSNVRHKELLRSLKFLLFLSLRESLRSWPFPFSMN